MLFVVNAFINELMRYIKMRAYQQRSSLTTCTVDPKWQPARRLFLPLVRRHPTLHWSGLKTIQQRGVKNQT